MNEYRQLFCSSLVRIEEYRFIYVQTYLGNYCMDNRTALRTLSLALVTGLSVTVMLVIDRYLRVFVVQIFIQ